MIRFAISVFAVLVVSACFLTVTAGLLDWAVAPNLLDTLSVFLSGPVLFSGTVVVFLLLFKEQVRGLIDRRVEARTPGESSPALRQALLPIPAAPTDTDVPLGVRQEGEINRQLAELEAEVQGGKEKRRRLKDGAQLLLENKEREATFWRFKYLESHLADRSKLTLENVALFQVGIRLSALRAWLRSVSPDDDEVDAVIETLRDQGLIRQDGELVSITERGRALLGFIRGQGWESAFLGPTRSEGD